MFPGPLCGSGAGALYALVCAWPTVRPSVVPRASKAPSATSASTSAYSSASKSCTHTVMVSPVCWTHTELHQTNQCERRGGLDEGRCHSSCGWQSLCVRKSPLRSMHQLQRPPPPPLPARLHVWLGSATAAACGLRTMTASCVAADGLRLEPKNRRALLCWTFVLRHPKARHRKLSASALPDTSASARVCSLQGDAISPHQICASAKTKRRSQQP